MSLAGPLRKVASKLVTKFGGLIVYRKVSNGVYNPETGTISESNIDVTIRGVLDEVNNREVGGLVAASDKKLTIAAADLSTPPSAQDQVIINSIVHQIIQISIVEQDNSAITYDLILRS
jgi:hypothetical protein